MSFVNINTKEIHCKIVYCGPSLGGKTSNIKCVYNKFNHSSKLLSLAGNEERTFFFDCLPIDVGEIRGFKTRFHLYTVPGQIALQTTRRIVLRGVDGIVFVADSQEERLKENLQALEDLKHVLESYEQYFSKIPMVFQYNKRDLSPILSVAELRTELNHWNKPDFEAITIKQIGVFETLKSISKSVVAVLKGGDIV